ncbi:hypothetical protein GCM10023169_27030 [Georgenia halophila]|uniref:GTP cyclohydrolase 1 type 2 homolog n=1 Tax=Georgenia halophila TaxID=620889 RepID=A0ABP8LCU8_9MICO
MLTAREITDRLLAEASAPPRENTVDGFVAGDPDAPVSGVATVMMPTLDALRGAVDRGCNLVISHEPLFYDHLGDHSALEADQDPVYLAKREFLVEHGLVVWRFHDGWHDRNPDGVLTGVLASLQERADVAPPEGANGTAQTTLGDLAENVGGALGASALRVVGDPELPVSLARVSVQPGFVGFARNRGGLANADVLIIGEGHEWEIGQYVTDAAALGLGKGMIVVGHAQSEAAGMDECARWLRTFLEDVPVEFVGVPDPYRAV